MEQAPTMYTMVPAEAESAAPSVRSSWTCLSQEQAPFKPKCASPQATSQRSLGSQDPP